MPINDDQSEKSFIQSEKSDLNEEKEQDKRPSANQKINDINVKSLLSSISYEQN